METLAQAALTVLQLETADFALAELANTDVPVKMKLQTQLNVEMHVHHQVTALMLEIADFASAELANTDASKMETAKTESSGFNE